MTSQSNSRSTVSESALLGSTDKRIYWSPIFNEYGLICQPSPEILVIDYCPFCGTHLPPSLRNEWFKRLEETGWDTWGDPIPEQLLSYGWEKL